MTPPTVRALQAPSVRFPVDPRDVPQAKAARRLGMTEAQFLQVQLRLFDRGFPRPDPDTGHYDLKAIDAWMDTRSGLTAGGATAHVSSPVRRRLENWDGGATRKA